MKVFKNLNTPSYIAGTDTLAMTGRTKSCGHLDITLSPAEKSPFQVMEKVSLLVEALLIFVCYAVPYYGFVPLCFPLTRTVQCVQRQGCSHYGCRGWKTF